MAKKTKRCGEEFLSEDDGEMYICDDVEGHDDLHNAEEGVHPQWWVEEELARLRNRIKELESQTQPKHDIPSGDEDK